MCSQLGEHKTFTAVNTVNRTSLQINLCKIFQYKIWLTSDKKKVIFTKIWDTRFYHLSDELYRTGMFKYYYYYYYYFYHYSEPSTGCNYARCYFRGYFLYFHNFSTFSQVIFIRNTNDDNNNANDNSPYSRKRNNFSTVISLPSQTWFVPALFCKLVLPVKKAEYCEKWLIGEDIYISQLFT